MENSFFCTVVGRIPIHFNTTQGGVSDVYIGVFVKKSSSVGCGKGFHKKIHKFKGSLFDGLLYFKFNRSFKRFWN